jgi:hypothetical protein
MYLCWGKHMFQLFLLYSEPLEGRDKVVFKEENSFHGSLILIGACSPS